MTGAATARTRGATALPAILFLAFAFLFQGFAVQTHIHTAVAAAAPAKTGHSGKTLPDDPAKCPLCQEFLLSGSFVMPAAVALPVPAAAVFTAVRLPAAQLIRLFPSHSWHGRAPPHA
jgi:hypothetical protein